MGNLEDGTGTIAIPANLAVGNYTVKVMVTDEVMELSGTDEINFTIPPKDTAEVVVGTDGENITIEAKDGTTPLNGTATVVIDGGEPITVPVDETGKASIPMDNLAPGQHTVEVTFAKDGYEPVTEVATITVPKATPVISVTGSEVSYGNPSTVDITVTDQAGNPINGTVIVCVSWIVDGVYDVVELAADGTGQASLRIDLINGEGTYDVTATYIENDKYLSAVNDTAKVTVTASTELTIEVTANEPTVGGDLIINVTGTDGSGQNVTITQVEVTIDDGEPVNVTVDENGQANLGKLDEGPHTITVKVDDGTHQVASEDITAVVSAPVLLGTDVTVEVNNITYGEAATIHFTVKDENGNPITTGKINITVGDKLYEDVPIDTGELTIGAGELNADTYPVVANYAGEAGKYDASTGTGDFNVAKVATILEYSEMNTTAIDVNVDGRIGEYFYVTLKDINGNPLANKPVQIGFNGVIYNRTTNESGRVRLQINLGKDNWYTFAISFIGDENYNASFGVARIVVETQTPKLTVPNKSYKASAKTKTLTATFKSAAGNLVKNRKVSFTVNGKTYSAKTDAKGVAKVNVSLTKKGTYTVTAKFAGDRTYSAITKKATLKIT